MRFFSALAFVLLLAGCGRVWNDPYPASESGQNILYSSFSERPKHLDPAQSYASDEYSFISQIYEPPLQYHYLKRPYTLIPATAAAMPRPRYFDSAGRELGADAQPVAYSVYEIRIKPGIYYQPHPAFAKDAAGRSLYFDLKPEELRGKHSLADFPKTGTRELVATDYVYQIKRLAYPGINSPILGHMSDYIVGLKEYAALLAREDKSLPIWAALARHEIAGVQLVDRYTYRIKVRGKYPQFIYWLAMPFFAPMPWEAEKFYAQPGMRERNLTLDWWPLGSGPFYLSENNPNERMVLTKNPNFSGEYYPSQGMPGDRAAGLLKDAGKPLPLTDKAVYSLEKETIPYWNKFLEGYYDASGISSDSFDQAVQVGVGGDARVTDAMQKQGITLTTSVATSTMYMGFNWLDPVVGGSSERARKLRQAISIAVDWEEFISIFANGRGIAAQSPIPPGIFGYRKGEAGIDHYVYDWVDGAPKRKAVSYARKLLAEAGYPGGIDAKTGQPLVIYLDTTATGVGEKARLDWLRKQFDKINLQLVVRSTDYNRFQDKVSKGDTQLFFYGWNADYPDPENFLFLLDGAQARVAHGGENASNYENPEYDRLFAQMKNMDNGPERQQIIDRMVEILQHDAPWMWGYHPKDYVLHHSWLYNSKPNKMATNNLKYLRVDAVKRDAMRKQWNRPVLWPFAVLGVALLALGGWLRSALRRREERTG